MVDKKTVKRAKQQILIIQSEIAILHTQNYITDETDNMLQHQLQNLYDFAFKVQQENE